MRQAPLLLIALLLFTGARAAEPVKNPDTFVQVDIGDVDSLDPAWSYDAQSGQVIANVYEFLLGYKDGSLTELEPVLAAEVPSRKNGLISADGLAYTFPIRRGVKFQDGQTLTAEDVKYSFLRFMLTDRAGGPSAVLLDPILGLNSTRDAQGKLLPDVFKRADAAITVKGDSVVVRLAKPYAPFLAVVESVPQIVSKEWCVKQGAWDGTEATLEKFNNPRHDDSPLTTRMNGTGAFALERWDRANRQEVLRRFDGYWRGPAKLKRVVIKHIDDFNTRKLMLGAGDADVIAAAPSSRSLVSGLPGVDLFDDLRVLRSPSFFAFVVDIDPAGNRDIGSGKLDGEGIPPTFFKDKDVRLGFAYAVDYDAYVRDALQGLGRRTRGLIREGMTGHDPDAKTYKRDPARAVEHFKKAWGGQVWSRGFKLTLVYTSNRPDQQLLASVIKRGVEALNPKFKIDARSVLSSTSLQLAQDRKLPVYIARWFLDFPDPHNLAYPFMHSGGYYSLREGYSNPEADALIEKAVRTLDPQERARLYKRVQEIEYEDVPHVLVADEYSFRVQRKWVKGWTFSPIRVNAPAGNTYWALDKAP